MIPAWYVKFWFALKFSPTRRSPIFQMCRFAKSRHTVTEPPNIEFIVEDEDSGVAMKTYQFMGKCTIDLAINQVDSKGQSKFKHWQKREE